MLSGAAVMERPNCLNEKNSSLGNKELIEEIFSDFNQSRHKRSRHRLGMG